MSPPRPIAPAEATADGTAATADPDATGDGLANAVDGITRPPLPMANPTETTNASARVASDTAMAGVMVGRDPGSRGGDRRQRDGTTKVTRTVDMAARQADQLLLAQRLGYDVGKGGAAVRGIRRLDRPDEVAVAIDRSQERADDRVRRVSLDQRQPHRGLRDGGTRPLRERARRLGEELLGRPVIGRRGGCDLVCHSPSWTVGGLDGRESSTFRVLP